MMKKNMGTLKQTNFLKKMAKEAAEAVSYFKAMFNNVNLINLEKYLREIPSCFESDEFCEIIG